MRKLLLSILITGITTICLFFFTLWTLIRVLYALNKDITKSSFAQKLIENIRSLPIFNYVIPLITFGIILGFIIIILWIWAYIEYPNSKLKIWIEDIKKWITNLMKKNDKQNLIN